MAERDLSNDLAIIALGGRFPGASDVAQLWRNLLAGHNAAEPITDEEIRAAGVPEEDLNDPAYVKIGNFIDRPGAFDAAFFDYSPKEAELIDPQQRLFLECAWETLETAGYDPSRYDGRIGVAASVSANRYQDRVRAAADDPILGFEARISNDKDFIATRVGYKLGLRGPCVSIQTACSSSLVAVHSACQTLLNGEADLMLAGGATVLIPQKTGYLYREGFILSPDGLCRAYDADAQGCNGGNGIGVVLLKRLEEALEDGDFVWATVRASAINNDGQNKVGFTAPSVEGQAEVISEALSVAELDPDTMDYVEGHGTGTELGDPIEVAALTKAYRDHTDRVGYCALGSVKTNIGHLDAAAGVAGLIKAALVLHHGVVPPSPYFRRPNPELGMEASPFTVHRETYPLPRGDRPRRAAVSAFGIGGTNAHAVLEEAPPREPEEADDLAELREHHLLVLSARSDNALEATADRLADALENDPDTPLADVTYTLQQGRRRFEHRRAVVAADRAGLVAALRDRDPKATASLREDAAGVPVSFLFPGGGAQYLRMGRDLYRTERGFREPMDRCCDFLARETGYDPRELLYPRAGQEPPAAELERTSKALPALFAVEYALAQLFLSLGVTPRAVIGHSLGEYTAACLAGVFSLEDALRLVTRRGELFERLPEGAMLSAGLSEAELRGYFDGLGEEMSIAAVNGPELSVASGGVEAIEALRRKLEADGVEARRLHIAVAAHSHLVESILDDFRAFVDTIDLHPPELPLLSNVEGTWATADSVTDPDYWVRHLRHTVRFGAGLRELLTTPEQVLLEVGPGRTLGHFAQQAGDRDPATRVLTTLRHPKDQRPDDAFFLETLGKLWLFGVELDWDAFHGGPRRRVALPTYPFERLDLLLPPVSESPRGRRRGGPVWLPVWRRSTELPTPADPGERDYLILSHRGALGPQLAERLEAAGERVLLARDRVLDAPALATLESLLEDPSANGGPPLRGRPLGAPAPLTVVSLLCWGSRKPGNLAWSEEVALLRNWVTAAAAVGRQRDVRVVIVASGAAAVAGEGPDPCRASLAALLDPIHLEFPHLSVSMIDLSPGPDDHPLPMEVLGLLRETRGDRQGLLALRGSQRWTPGFEPLTVPGDSTPAAAEDGACLVLGAGPLGRALADELHDSLGRPLVMVSRSPFAPSGAAGAWLDALRDRGADVTFEHGNLEDRDFVNALIARVRGNHRRIVGVVDAVGPGGDELAVDLAALRPDPLAEAMTATARRLTALDHALDPEEPRFCLISSCLASLAGGVGGADAAIRHRHLEAWVNARNRRAPIPWTVVVWDAWDFSAVTGSDPRSDQALHPDEGRRVFRRLLGLDPQDAVLVSRRAVETWLEERRDAAAAPPPEPGGEAAADRPQLTTPYVAPSTELEERVVSLFRELLGISTIGIHDSFFELGGSSLMAAKAVSRVREEFGFAPPLAQLFEDATPAALAALLAAARVAGSGAPPPDGGDAPDADREVGEI